MLNFNLDKVSYQILALLQENSRISYTEIGKIVNLSSSSVIERIKKLEEAGIIAKYTININHKALNYNIVSIMMVSLSGIFSIQEKAFSETMMQFHQVIECLRITGTNDFLIKVITKSIEELKIVNDEVARFGQVNSSIVVYDFLEHKSIDIKKLMNCPEFFSK
ncbi:MAG TPA: Lrp/AsnC family transcriptional regulator [Candidatus Gastranaerophilales bacterium]|nr:Lrp/AsnC family transcriptional regulator [Candidatus Gastranaerophilales bacterium]